MEPSVTQSYAGEVRESLEGDDSRLDPRSIREASTLRTIGDALAEIGDLYREGKISPRKGRRAADYYLRMAKVVARSSLFAIIEPVELAGGPEQVAEPDPSAAVAVYQTAAELGSAVALSRLGDMHYAGEGVPADYGRAFEFYSRAAEAGNEAATLRAGEMLARGEGVTQDVERGRAMVRQIARSDSASALLSLGDLYSGADTGSVDAVAATKAYERAAELGEPRALIRLGDMFRDGKVVPVNGERAVDYYVRATRLGSAAIRSPASHSATAPGVSR